MWTPWPWFYCSSILVIYSSQLTWDDLSPVIPSFTAEGYIMICDNI